MKFKARIRALHEHEFAVEVPEADIEESNHDDDDRRTQTMVNEAAVLKARAAAAKEAEKIADDLLGDVVEFQVEEVVQCSD